MKTRIYHNPCCSKSRATLQLLRDRGIEPEVVEYLEAPPDAETLAAILTLLGLEPRELIRRKEAEYQALGLDDESLDRDALIGAMAAHPILIERPIIVHGDRAAVGRPPENILAIL